MGMQAPSNEVVEVRRAGCTEKGERLYTLPGFTGRFTWHELLDLLEKQNDEAREAAMDSRRPGETWS